MVCRWENGVDIFLRTRWHIFQSYSVKYANRQEVETELNRNEYVILFCLIEMFNSIFYGGVALYRVVVWNKGDELIFLLFSNALIVPGCLFSFDRLIDALIYYCNVFVSNLYE